MHPISFILIFFTIIISLAFIRAQDVNDFNKPLPVFRNILKLDSVEVYNALLSVASSTTIDLNHPATVFLIADTQGSSSLDTTLQSQLSTLQQQLPAASSKFSSVRIYLQLNTQRRSKTLATLEAEVDTMLNLYDDGSSISVEGIFVDHNVESSDPSGASLSYDSGISNYIRTTKGKKMFYHPRSEDGCASADRSCLRWAHCTALADYVVAFDGSFSEFIGLGLTPRTLFGTLTDDLEKFAVMISSGVTNSIEARTTIIKSFADAQIFNGFISIAAGSIQNLLPSLLHISTSVSILSSHRNRRGMFFLIYGYKVGIEQFATNSTWLANYELILIHPEKTDAALENLRRLGVNSIVLHAVFKVMQSPELSNDLRNFMYRARKFYGVDEILFNPDTFTMEESWSQLAVFNNNSAALAGGDNSNSEERTLWCFDGVITEIKLLSGGKISDALAVLDYVKNQGRPVRRFKHIPFSYNIYAGGIVAENVRTLVSLNIDTLFVFANVQNPANALTDMQPRIDALMSATISPTYVANPQHYAWTSVCPSFSAEGETVKAAAEVFLGDWIYRNSPGALGKLEAFVWHGITNTWTNQIEMFSGFQWYEYFFVDVYTAHTRNADTLLHITTTAAPSPPATDHCLCFCGTYSATGSMPCSSCMAGEYVSSAGATSCLACAHGSVPSGDQCSCNQCRAGTFETNADDARCTNCGAGKYCPTDGMTSATAYGAGYYCPGPTDISATPCPVGNKCPGPNENAPTPCEANTYQDQRAQAACIPCPSGTTEGLTGRTSAADCVTTTTTTTTTVLCSCGTYSATGSMPCSTCMAGEYVSSTGATSCLVCAHGSIPSGDRCSCDPCLAGTFELNADDAACTNCGVGKYCPTDGMTSATDCGAGNFCPGPTDASATRCAIGNKCPGPNENAPTPCEANTYQDQSGQTSCTSCPIGSSTNGATGSDALTDCQCQPGYFSATGNAPCTAAAAGKYVASPGAMSETNCSAGHFCPGTANTGPTDCGAGNFCPGPTDAAATPCFAGHKCPDANHTAPTPCEVNTYQNQTGQTSCIACPSGTTQDLTRRTSAADCVTTAAPVPAETTDPACFVFGNCIATLVVILLLLLLLLLLLCCLYLRNKKKKEKKRAVQLTTESSHSFMYSPASVSPLAASKQHQYGFDDEELLPTTNAKLNKPPARRNAAAPRPRQEVVQHRKQQVIIQQQRQNVAVQQQRPSNQVDSDPYFNFLGQPIEQQRQQQQQQPTRKLNAQDKRMLLSKYDDI